MSLDTVLSQADSNLDTALERLFALLRIPSISTDPAYKDDCRAAADWLVAELGALGFEASRRDTPGHPMVVAHHKADGPHVLFYGHYDVQPVDPLDLWHRDPFDPAIEDTDRGKVIRARGASDDKGQLMTFIEAFRAYRDATGSLPGNITILLEGEEESGSPSLIPFLEANREELSCDIACVCDTELFDAQTPAITTMLRGMATNEFTIHAANRDLHSGMFGGPAANPLRIMANVLAGLHDPETGRCTLPGFYDGVEPVPNAIKAGWDSLNYDGQAFLGTVGLSHSAGEAGYSILEQIWARPTCEINGMWGGYTGAGFKTVLPAEAHAKVSFRLVGKQDPAKLQAALKDYIEASLPEDCSLTFHAGKGAPGMTLPADDPVFETARTALGAEWPNEAVFVGCGGSIPIVGMFRDILDMNTLMIGFALNSDNIHSPNEKYDLASFHHGIRSWIRVIDAVM